MSLQEPPAPKTRWAYAYELTPPQPEARLRAVRSLIESAHNDAKLEARIWEGRLVVEPQITHILVVCDDPLQDGQVNLSLESALRELHAEFLLTVAVPLPTPA
jgi:hypothetical protein